jgi:hypothetical protein
MLKLIIPIKIKTNNRGSNGKDGDDDGEYPWQSLWEEEDSTLRDAWWHTKFHLKLRCQVAPPFASGIVFLSAMLDRLTVQCFYNRDLLNILQANIYNACHASVQIQKLQRYSSTPECSL